MDIYKVPSCCSCHIMGYSYVYPPLKSGPFAFILLLGGSISSVQCLNPFRRRGWDGIIPTTSGEATSGRNYEFSTSHERQSQFTTSGEATSGRNWDCLEWQVENSPSLPLLLKGLSLSYRKWKLQLWGIGKQSLLVSRDWPIPYS